MRVGIALGSNLGNRLANLRTARNALRELHDDSAPFLASPVYETSPVGCAPDAPAFLNAVIELSCSVPPFDLLEVTRQIENQLGRPSEHGVNEPRTIDIDLLYVGSISISHSSLTLPHPRIHERLFVLAPLSDINPDFNMPDGNKVRNMREVRESLGLESVKLFSRTWN